MSKKQCCDCEFDKYNTSYDVFCHNHVGVCGNYEKWKPKEICAMLKFDCDECIHADNQPSCYLSQGCINQSKFVAGCAGIGLTEQAKHYQTGQQQPIEVMQNTMNPEQFAGFLLGNVIKYAMRMNHKGKMREDAGKCRQYAEWLTDALDGKVIVPGGK